jgi:hypothetical protein
MPLAETALPFAVLLHRQFAHRLSAEDTNNVGGVGGLVLEADENMAGTLLQELLEVGQPVMPAPELCAFAHADGAFQAVRVRSVRYAARP